LSSSPGWKINAMPTTISDYTKLSIPERLALIGEIWDSIVAEGRPIGLTDEQRAEIDRRRKLAEDGQARWVSWEDVKRASYEHK
jgi:putative addiction module component (TIGR02574 family)